MYEKKKINVMYTNTRNPGIKWCKEAYEHADVIIMTNKSHYHRIYTDKKHKAVYFICIVATDKYAQFSTLRLDGNKYTIDAMTKQINFS